MPATAAPSATAACFGKLPTHADFVRHRAGGRALQALDGWLQRGMDHARLRGGLDARFDEAGAVCFIVDPPAGEHVLAGAFRPSRDRTGRRYPFLVAVEVARTRVEGRRLPCWPARYRAFFEEAAALTADAVEGRLPSERLGEALGRLGALFEHTPFLMDYEYRLRHAGTWALWTRLWGSPEDGRKYVLLKRLTDAFEAAHGRAPHPPLRFPLPPAPELFDVSFWLEVCWRLFGRPPAEPAVYWSSTGSALFVAAEPPPPALFGHLLGLQGSDGGSLHLDRADGQPAALAALALPPRLGTLLEDPALSFRAFLDRL